MEEEFNVSKPRLLRPVETPLALYFRPGRNDHKVSAQTLSDGLRGIRGMVFHAGLTGIQEELRAEAKRTNVEAVLDTRMIELSAMPNESTGEIPWASLARLEFPEIAAARKIELAEMIAEVSIANGFTSVIAPTHFLPKLNDPWLDIDISVAESLRAALDSRGGSAIPIYYTLSIPSATLRELDQVSAFVAKFRGIPVDSVWLRVHSFGTSASGPIALRGYIEGCQELHKLGIPLVAERTGTIGLALLAFGAVGGIESGITVGESFDYKRLTRPRNNSPFLVQSRVYVKELGAFLGVKKARDFFARRLMKTFFACRESCCPRGVDDTLGNPRRHFLMTRTGEVARLSSPPVALRRQYYLEEFLRPATDRAVQASRQFPALENQRRRLDSWRGTLGSIAKEMALKTWSEVPTGRRKVNRPRVSA